MTGLFKRLLEVRNVGGDFLSPKYEESLDSYLLPDMEKVVERIKLAIKNREKVLIYGDYDADGVTASALMHDALKMAGVKEIQIMLPDRFKDGYGMSKRVVQRAQEVGCGLVVTVDCGSNNAEIIDELGESGVDVIVTDHHELMGEAPRAVAVVNPKRKDAENEELRELAGVGVAFKVAQALAKEGLIPEGREKWLLDLVLIGTICDSMLMRGENRRLCFYGMVVLKKLRRTGLRELIRAAKIRELDSDAIMYQIGPRINAAGRMDSAEKALVLLMSESKIEAAKLAAELEKLNEQRKAAQETAVKEVEEQGVGEEPVIVATGKWHEGVLGIIAGRLVEDYKRPVFVLTETDGIYKGSGRSFGEFNLAQALSECQKYIVGGGGHAGACGLKVPEKGILEFSTEINKYYRSLKLTNQERFLEIHEDVTTGKLGEFSLDLMDELKKLEPYGMGNEEPVFKLRDVMILNTERMGAEKNHLKLTVRGEDGEILRAVAFAAPEEWLNAEKGMRADIYINTVLNEWNGLKSVEGRIIKMCLKSEDNLV